MDELLILSRDAAAYERLIKEADFKQLKMHTATEPGGDVDALKDVTIIMGEPDLVRDILPDMKQVQWVQSTWAGITPLVKSGSRTDYILTGIKGIFGPAMAEYVTCYMLMHERDALEKYASQQKREWNPGLPGQLKGKSIGILGIGSIGSAIAETAKFFGMKTKGYSRTLSACEFIDEPCDNPEALQEFVHNLDYLVSTLPDTPATRGLLDRNIFKAMKPEALLINVGRGSVLNEAALVEAVTRKEISGAVLDVFQEEPLPGGHPFWSTPGIILTFHTAAVSFPKEIAPVFIENYQLFSAGRPLKYRVDLNQGY